MINNKLKAALLPLYLELYDDYFNELRPRINKFLKEISEELKAKGIELMTLPVCRVKNEFDKAMADAEKEDVYALVTIHLAYSPSLESINALIKTNLPIIVLDTTPIFSFSTKQNSEEIMYNHGIHGVQDMCNMLLKNGKYFTIEAGHYKHSDILDKVVNHIKAAKIHYNLKNGRTGIIGNPFAGMGDFYVEDVTFKKSIGTTIIQEDKSETEKLLTQISNEEIEKEINYDKKEFEVEGIDPALHRTSVKSGLALRKWIEKEKLTSVTINFLDINKKNGLPTMPFLEISKLLGKGIGYAGEGDTLTASLVGALSSVYDEVTFTEMFCPDWEGNTIFMSHMGELNPKLTDKKAKMKVLPWRFSTALDPVLLTACYKPGNGILVNLAPGKDEQFSMILAPVSIIADGDDSDFENSVRSWIKPEIPVVNFLKAYSRIGGTHHSALVYNGDLNMLIEFGKMMGWKLFVLNKHFNLQSINPI